MKNKHRKLLSSALVYLAPVTSFPDLLICLASLDILILPSALLILLLHSCHDVVRAIDVPCLAFLHFSIYSSLFAFVLTLCHALLAILISVNASNPLLNYKI